MKKNYYLLGIALSLCFSSCIQEEALNVEAAIDNCSGENIQLVSLNNEKKEIDVYITPGSDISQQELKFELPEGATLVANEKEPKDNPPLYDFSHNKSRIFTVTSEDKANSAEYNISIIQMELPLEYSFENLQAEEPYHIIYLSDTSRKLTWSSGNPGFYITNKGSSTTFPTVQVAEGKNGYCVKLETKDTGELGGAVGMPIASGNLFIGSFNTSSALNEPLKATQFGYPFTEIPTKMSGYFKFKAGPQMIQPKKENGIWTKKNIPGKDRFDIYAVMYEAEKSDFFLNGGNSITDKNIVKMARIKKDKAIETDEWTYFSLPFEEMNGKSIDKDKLKKGKYKLAIVLSSSVDGAYFKGAIGSTLYVDELKIEVEPNN